MFWRHKPIEFCDYISYELPLDEEVNENHNQISLSTLIHLTFAMQMKTLNLQILLGNSEDNSFSKGLSKQEIE